MEQRTWGSALTWLHPVSFYCPQRKSLMSFCSLHTLEHRTKMECFTSMQLIHQLMLINEVQYAGDTLNIAFSKRKYYSCVFFAAVNNLHLHLKACYFFCLYVAK